MKKTMFFAALLGLVGLGLWAQVPSLKGMSINGTTGLWTIPSARIPWERSSNLGLDLGVHTVIRSGVSVIPKFALSLFKWVELTGAFDIQPGTRQSDMILGAKVQIPLQKVALAFGGNYQLHNIGSNYSSSTSDFRYHQKTNATHNSGQFYGAITYAGHFFNMPAETTVVVGKTFIEHNIDSSIDYGMGFDLVIFPKQLNNLIHWITEYSNFSYSTEPFRANSWDRGVFNTGFRIDLSRIKGLGKFKFALDVLLVDGFDANRSFSAGLVFGLPIL
ncbi:MAG: hypothetical protein LBL43_01320 [Treponema sp.]|jgi:hypothetical protein|nr:hypothetical protein [Treponema sp.]